MVPSPDYNTAVDQLLVKLPKRSGCIDLFEVLRDLHLAPSERATDKLQKPYGLTRFEQYLLRGALPHLVQQARTLRDIFVVPQTPVSATPPGTYTSEPRGILPALVRTPLNVDGDASFWTTNLPASPIILTGAGSDGDVCAVPQLLVTEPRLREALIKLPRWVSWNQWAEDEKQAVRAVCTIPALSGRSCHAACRRGSEPGSDAFEATFTPHIRPYIPEYLRRRKQYFEGLDRDDPLALLRTYCKHFHAGEWMKEYERLVDDLRECTFQPNIHKFLRPNLSDLTPPDDPFLANNPFATVKELKETTQRHRAKQEKLESRPFDDTPGDPKYRCPWPPSHQSCLLSHKGPRARVSVPGKGHRLTVDGLCLEPQKAHEKQKRRQSGRPRPWHLTLREGYVPAPFSTRVSEDPHPFMIDPKKARRYHGTDWARYIRLRGRHVAPVCIPDVGRLEAIVRDAGPPWPSREPLNVCRPYGRRTDAVTLLLRTSSEEYSINQKRNLQSIIRHGVVSGELVAPLAVVAVETNPIVSLEAQLQAAAPVSLVKLDENKQRGGQRCTTASAGAATPRRAVSFGPLRMGMA